MIKPRFNGLYIDEERVSLYSGAVHYWRLEHDKWEEILDKVKGMRFAAITSYIPWEIHEVQKGVFDFGSIDQRKDIDDFLTLCEKKGVPSFLVVIEFELGFL